MPAATASAPSSTSAPFSLPSVFPALQGQGPRVDPRTCVEPGTGASVAAGWIIAGVLGLGSVIASFGTILIAGAIGWVVVWMHRKRVMAQLRGSAIAVGPSQFPQIHACVTAFSERLEMRAAPLVFIVESNNLNAAALKVAGQRVVLLIDDVVDACLRSGNPQTLAFLIGHELGHHALGHTNAFRGYLSRVSHKLSRLDEFSADQVAHRLVDDAATTRRALALLASGPQLMPYLDFASLERQADEVAADPLSVKSEKMLTHPLLLRRLARFSGSARG